MKIIVPLVVAAFFAGGAIEVQACACCSDEGEYYLTTQKPGEFEWAQIEALQFGDKARLFLTDAGHDVVKGIQHDDEVREYELASDYKAKEWRLTFRDAKGRAGVLTLPLGVAKMTKFGADLRDGRTSAGGGPLLYKEWRFEGSARGDGIFASGFVSPATFSLVFQGGGNRCEDASNFVHWRLQVTGKKAAFALFGDLVLHGDPP